MDFDFIEDEAVREKAIQAHKESMEKVEGSIQEKIDAAVEGLSAKNAELLGEKKDIQQKLQEFADITDPQKALEALKFLDENADAQLIKDGKINELIEKRTSSLRSDHEAAMNEVKAKLEEAAASSARYKGKFETKVIEDTIRAAATEAGVLPAALTDILMRGNPVFSLGANGEVEARDDQGNLLKNSEDMVVTPKNWVAGLKNTSPHYWPTSEGAGAYSANASDADLADQLEALVKKGDMAGYRDLRAKMMQKK